MTKSATLLFLLILFISASCKTKNTNCLEIPDIENITVDIKIKRNEDALMKIKSEAEMRTFLKNNKEIATTFFASETFPNDSITASEAFKLISNPHIDTLYQEVKKSYASLDSLENELERAFRILKYYYPEFKEPKIQTVISGLNQDLLISDSLVIIGLDYYLGPKSKFKPLNMPNYLARRFDKPYIVPSIVLLMINKYNESNLMDKTFLADMLFYGKSYYFAKRLMPCIPDSILIGYKAEEWKGSEDHQHITWASLLENNMLYETRSEHKQKFLSERPKTLEIGDRCPGRIGQYTGWKLVQAYMENQNVSIPELMKEKNSQKILKLSVYKPVSPY